MTKRSRSGVRSAGIPRRRVPRPSLRFGFFGGSFDPVHNAHLALADAARRELKLHRVYFVPAFRPPHKTGTVLAPARRRAAMLRAALAGRPGLRVSLWEVQKGGVSYTARSLRAFKRLHAPARWHLLVGGDSLAGFKTWRAWRWILDNSRVVVGERRGVARSRYPAGLKENVFFLREKLPKVSSTDIRRRISRGRSIRGLVPPAVEKYIRRNRLYGEEGLHDR